MASGPDESNSGLTKTAGRAAMFPARTAARVWRDQLEAAVDEVLSAPEMARVIDRALEGPLPEEIARSIVRHRVLERVVAEVAATGELERLVAEALVSPRTRALTDQVLSSDEMRHAMREVAASPEVRAAITRQTTGFVEEVAERVRASAVRLDDRADRRGRPSHPPFAGIVTRAAALAVDALLAIAVYILVVGAAALVASLVGGLHPHWFAGVLLAVGWVAISGAYFLLFWSSAGQTPGMRLLRLRVRTAAGSVPSLGRSLVRLVGLELSIALLFLGFLPVLFDERRRGLADFLAGTVVVYDEHSDQGNRR
jgi:uncharacterized RDD family membrane protein YckC